MAIPTVCEYPGGQTEGGCSEECCPAEGECGAQETSLNSRR